MVHTIRRNTERKIQISHTTRFSRIFLNGKKLFIIVPIPSDKNSRTSHNGVIHRGAEKSLARTDWRSNWKTAIFRPTRKSLLLRRPGWTDNFLHFFFFLSGLQILSLVASFLPGRAKDSSAPRYLNLKSNKYFLFQRQCRSWLIGKLHDVYLEFIRKNI